MDRTIKLLLGVIAASLLMLNLQLAGVSLVKDAHADDPTTPTMPGYVEDKGVFGIEYEDRGREWVPTGEYVNPGREWVPTGEYVNPGREWHPPGDIQDPMR